MKEITLQVPDQEYGFIMKLINNLKFVKVTTDDQGNEKARVVAHIKDGFEDMKAINEGKKKGVAFNDLLNEL